MPFASLDDIKCDTVYKCSEYDGTDRISIVEMYVNLKYILRQGGKQNSHVSNLSSIMVNAFSTSWMNNKLDHCRPK